MGKKISRSPLRFTRPLLPDLDKVMKRFRLSWDMGMVTKGKITEEYEKRAAAYLNLPYAASVSSCTSGLILALRALNLEGDCLVPSFTFTSTIQALLWNNLNPIFVDCHPSKFTVGREDLEASFTPRISAVVVPYVFGNPPPLLEIRQFCQKKKIPLIVDAAHAFGSSVYGKKPGGLGTVEVFSTSATKLLCTGEGGMITTRHSRLSELILLLREYGHNAQYETQNLGLNGRMTEFQAAVGIEGLALLEKHAQKRKSLAKLYQKHLSHLPLIFQDIEPDCESSYKDFAVVLKQKEWGITRDQAAAALARAGIPTRRYFFPPMHKQHFFLKKSGQSQTGRTGILLPHTEKISDQILCLPIYYDLREDDIHRVADEMTRVFKKSKSMLKGSL